VSEQDDYTEFEMPPLFVATDSYAVKWQKRFLLCQKAQLIALITAAVGGATSWYYESYKLSAILTAVSLVAALFVRFYLAKVQPERKWYNGRAAAESIKTLSWKYAQCAIPFPKSLSKVDANRLFIDRVKQVLSEVPTLDEPVAHSSEQITDDMREIRAKSLTERQKYYIQLRIKDQITWYAKKATFNSVRASRWSKAIGLLELAALGFALLRISGGTDFDWVGILVSASAAGVAWLQSKQHETLAQSYSVTSHELASVNSMLSGRTTEAKWAEQVEQAEEAMSREHTLWKASHS
jgi:hypothetical protein